MLATIGALSLALGLAACGSSSSGSTSAASQQDGGFRNSAQGEKIRKALQNCGVTLPNRGQDGPPSDTTAS